MADTKQHKMQQAAARKKRKSGKWYPGKLISERRAKRKKEDKWVLGEKLTKAGIKVERGILARSGKVRKDVKGVEVTGKTIDKAQAFPKYEKKSKAAKSFRAAFASNCKGKGAGSTFSWDGRSYSCARASDKPVATKKQVVSKSKKSKYDTAKERAVELRKRGFKIPPSL